MTDADTLTLAYFRQEFQITSATARVLLALWNARRPLTPDEVLHSARIGPSTIQVHMWRLRELLPDGAIPCNAPRAGTTAYTLTSKARREIAGLLTNAATGILAGIGEAA